MRNFLIFITLSLIISCGKDDSSTDVTPISKYTLSVTLNDGGEVSSPGGSYNEGSSVTITATPNSEYLFENWSNGSTENPLTITVNRNISLTANFVKRKYPLTINIQGEGTVREEIVSSAKSSDPKEYNSGTTVRLTAIPTGEWTEFQNWSGSINSSEKVVELFINERKEINVLFEESDVILKSNNIILPMNEIDLTSDELDQTISIVSGPFHYLSSGKNYMLFPGQANWVAGRPDIGIQERTEENRVPSFTFVKENSLWKYNNSYQTPGFWGPRNFEKINDIFFICDGNEIGDLSQGDTWEGDLFMGQIIEDGNIIWTRVNSNNEMGYYHGLGVGDLNGDGLIDVGVAPGNSRVQLFYQNEDRSFSIDTTKIRVRTQNINWTSNYSVPFTLQISDLDNDNLSEIITASYGGGDPNNDQDLNDIRIYKLNQNTNQYDPIFISRVPQSIYNIGLGATSIKVLDINNDNKKDFIVAREGLSVNSFDVWTATSNFEYSLSFTSPIYSEQDLMFREFLMMDVNNDNYDDIILRPHANGSLYRVNPCNNNIRDCGGVKLNNVIWINNHDGTFSNYDSHDLICEEILTYNLFPYMENGILHFMGIYNNDQYDSQMGELITSDLKVRIRE